MDSRTIRYFSEGSFTPRSLSKWRPDIVFRWKSSQLKCAKIEAWEILRRNTLILWSFRVYFGALDGLFGVWRLGEYPEVFLVLYCGREWLGVEICEKHMYHPEAETREYPASEFTSRRLLSSISRTLRSHLND